LDEIENGLRGQASIGGAGSGTETIQSDHEMRTWALKGFEAQ
jgi:hypothetical protein